MTDVKVKFLRKGYGVTLHNLAEHLKISVPTLRKKEKGDVEWTRSDMINSTQFFKTYDETLTIEKIFFTN